MTFENENYDDEMYHIFQQQIKINNNCQKNF